VDQSTLRALALVSGLGFVIALEVGLFFVGGLWLDGVLNTRPLFLLLGLLFGFVMAGISIAELMAFHRGGGGRLLRRRRPDAPRMPRRDDG
jgi:F0F1-type ATP synthase assembly protein I